MARNRQLEQLSIYSGFRLPKTVVTRIKKGDWSVNTLIKSIKKFNDTSRYNNPNWEDELRQIWDNGPNNVDRLEAIFSTSRQLSFWKSEDNSFASALNQAIRKVSDKDPSKSLLLNDFGKLLDINDWVYDADKGVMTTAFNGYIYELAFNPESDGNYEGEVLEVKKVRSVLNG